MRLTRLPAMIIIALIITSPVFSANNANFLKSTAVFVDKEADNKIEVVKTYLLPRAVDGKVKIWAFFTDKNVVDQAQFDELAATVTLTEAASARREKMGLSHITFADLPVHSAYIEEIESLGGDLRRQSRWLNAASFEIPHSQIDKLNDLWFVAKVRPVASFYREKEIPSIQEPDYLKNEHPEYTLDYGVSFGQLNQINVPAVHEMGYNGAGVIVAMFDTGYRKDHEAFIDAYNDGRVIAEWDFIFDDGNTQNEGLDWSTQHNHGTSTWSTLGGAVSGKLYGPAYGASFILAKTEDIRSETAVEEDNWAAAIEWADSIGASVVSSSLSYSDWYTYSDFDGVTAITSIAANLATSYGIVVVNSMGNAGPSAGTLGAPADALEILSIGAVTSTGVIASFSSRGPTADGRIKPEVCAQGVSDYVASASGVTSYSFSNGTSFSAPLIGGCAAVMMSARPSMTPQMVRLALMNTASKSFNPDNTYGWGIANLLEAMKWGANMGADVTIGEAPLTVSFFDSSYVPATAWDWSFGDGGSSPDQNPVHTFNNPGAYNVSLAITSDGMVLTDSVPNYVIVLADTTTYSHDTVYAGQQSVVDVDIINSQELEYFVIPIDFSGGMNMTLDSFSVAGTRADGFIDIIVGGSAAQKKLAVLIDGSSPLPPGSGTVLKLFFRTDPYAFGGFSASVDTVTVNDEGLKFDAGDFDYVPVPFGGGVYIRDVARGDANNDGTVNVGDPVFLINYVFKGGPGPITIESGDANFDFQIDVGDAVFLINYVFRDGPPPNDVK